MKNTKKHLIQGWSIILVTLLFVVPGIVYAINTVATGFQVNATAKIIDAHGTCHNVSTTDGSTQFVATKTSAEWASFRNNTPAGVSLGSCYTPLIMTVKTNDLSPP